VIDWFTVSAQIFNFLILVLLLKKFLYGPVLGAMDAREASIADRLGEASRQLNEAKNEIERYRKKNDAFDAEREELIAAAAAAAEQQKKEFIAAARQEVETIKAGWYESLRQEKESFLTGLKDRTAAAFTLLARKAFRDLADTSLEQHMTDLFVRKLNALEQKDLDAIRTKLKDSEDGIMIATSFEIPEHQLQEVRGAVQRITRTDAGPHVVISRDILCGIEMRAKGYTFGWSVESYLTSLEEEFGKAMGL